MIRYESIGGDLPPLRLSLENLTQLLINQFGTHPGTYFFTSFLDQIAAQIIKDRIGFDTGNTNTYTRASLNQGDQAKVREIVWDMIVDRHLTIGGAGHHDWPNFTVTERGKVYFQAHQKTLEI